MVGDSMDEIDTHLGRRLRRRRRLLGLTRDQREHLERETAQSSSETLASKETQDLIHAYYQLGERPRRRLLDLAKSLNGEHESA